MKKVICLLLCLVMALSVTAVSSAEEIVWDENQETILLTDGAVYGEGEKSFVLDVSYKGTITTVTVNTDAATVGEALLALDIIAGEDSDFGLYVKTVNGITADFNTDGTYWAFYIDGEYALTGVDSTEIDSEVLYTLAVDGLEWAPDEGETITLKDGRIYGTGEKSFPFTVIDVEENQTTVTIRTDAKTVGEALLNLYIIAGDESEWGLYVKTVSGSTVSFDETGKYWAFYVDGEYALTGVDTTEIAEGSGYLFKVE